MREKQSRGPAGCSLPRTCAGARLGPGVFRGALLRFKARAHTASWVAFCRGEISASTAMMI